MKNVLLIGDLVGHGRLAVGAQASVLTPKGINVSYLPTALVSNNFCYTRYALYDTTDYMRDSIRIWSELGFHFDVICLGFLGSDEQADMLADFCRRQKKDGALIMLDPIMGDNGHLYSGLEIRMIERLRRMVGVSDLTVPNYTEACYLTGYAFNKDGLEGSEVGKFIDSVRSLGASSVAVTSAKVDGKPCVLGYDAAVDEYFTVFYREIPVDFSGTGDIFSAKLISLVMFGKSLHSAVQITAEKLSALIDTCRDSESKQEGIPY